MSKQVVIFLTLFVSLFNGISLLDGVSSCSRSKQNEPQTYLQVSSAKELEPIISGHIQQGSLVLFDIDYVLSTPKDLVLRPCGESDNFRKKKFDELREKTKGKFRVVNSSEVSEFDYYLSVIIRDAQVELVDTYMPEVIHRLQAHRVPVLALSQNESGRVGLVADLNEHKFEELAALGIDFRNSHFDPDKKMHAVDAFFPVYSNGIILTGRAQKGETLIAFLESQNFFPTNIIFVDDRVKMLHSVETACQRLGIPFYGIHYTQLAMKNETVDPIIGANQFHHLYKKEVWLSDDQANKQLQEDL